LNSETGIPQLTSKTLQTNGIYQSQRSLPFSCKDSGLINLKLENKSLIEVYTQV
jgi:hypothetical protein